MRSPSPSPSTVLDGVGLPGGGLPSSVVELSAMGDVPAVLEATGSRFWGGLVPQWWVIAFFHQVG